MPDFMFLEYSTFGRIMEGLVAQLNRLSKKSGIYQFTHMFSPPRGGWPILVHLSHHFKDIEIIYDYENFLNHDVRDNQNVLFVDDIMDTGKTAQNFLKDCEKIIEYHPTFQYKTCSIYYKPRTIIRPDIYMQEVPDDTWVVFPWECTKECEYDKVSYEFSRKKELAMKTGEPIITSEQKPKNKELSNEEKTIWDSFLHNE